MSDFDPGSLVGSRFGPYQIGRCIGRGATGVVYEAQDTRSRSTVALKLISTAVTDIAECQTILEREVSNAERLTAPHMLPINSHGEIEGRYYVDMRLVDGEDLHTLMQEGPMTPTGAVVAVSQIAAALDTAHAVGVIHGNVKPGNILVGDDDFMYLSDFGIAQAVIKLQQTDTGTSTALEPGVAPEILSGGSVTKSADVYGLTCVLYECLTGNPPFATDSAGVVTGPTQQRVPPRPSGARPGVVAIAFDQVVARGMAADPAERYGSCRDLAAAALAALSPAEQENVRRALFEIDPNVPVHVSPPVAGVPPSPIPEPTVPRTAWPVTPEVPQEGRHQPDPGGGISPVTSPQRGPSRKLWLAAASVAVLALVAGLVGYVVNRPPGKSSETAGQTVLAFDGINFRLSPGGVALDKAGNVYVTNQGMRGKVVMLAAGSNVATVLPFTDLYEPQGLAVDGSGNAYVTDFNNRVVKLAAGSNDPTELPFTGLNYPEGVAVDAVGNVYVADRGNNRVVQLAPGSSNQTVLLTDLNHPDGVAVDNAGNVFVTDSDNNRVLKLAAGSKAPTPMPFTGLTVPWGIAVDNAGTVYVTDHDANKVVKLTSGSSNSEEMPFTGLNTPVGVAVDASDNVYIADRGNNQVVKSGR